LHPLFSFSFSDRIRFFPHQIDDEEAVKPDDWDDREFIPDPSDIKPADWDQPKYIPDPNVTKLADWDDARDGKWYPPIIRNPKFKNPWKQKQLPNPNYMGPWIRPKIRNPNFTDIIDRKSSIHIRYVGIDVWQVTAGSIFDNIFITDNEAEFEAFYNATWKRQRTKEQPTYFEDEEEKAREKARKEKEKKDKEELEKATRIIYEHGEDRTVPDADEETEWYHDDY
jgi:calreticulin